MRVGEASTNHMSRETPGIQEGAAGPDLRSGAVAL